MSYFHKIDKARGAKLPPKLGVPRVIAYMKTSLETGLFQQTMQGDFCLYPLAPSELIASIQNI